MNGLWTLWRVAVAAGVAGVAAAGLAAQVGAVWWEDPAWRIARSGAAVGWPVFLALLLARAAHLWWSGRGEATARSRDGGAAPLRLWEVLLRACLVAAVPLPRYLGDPAGGVVASFWIVALSACAYVFLEPALPPVWRRRFWPGAALFLVPWALPWWPTAWPPMR